MEWEPSWLHLWDERSDSCILIVIKHLFLNCCRITIKQISKHRRSDLLMSTSYRFSCSPHLIHPAERSQLNS